MRRYRPGLIKEIHGERLKIDYLPVAKELIDAVRKLPPNNQNDVLPSVHKTLWCHSKSPFVKHVGWCLENDVPLYCNPGN
uniref:Uncharacterized protein n=1 Tax=Romanomermis culicivorax TaxID=13658 RepID=A0A915KWS9_ROMCU